MSESGKESQTKKQETTTQAESREDQEQDQDQKASSKFYPPGLTVKIRNSDRVVFKRCRRKWNWSWSYRGNMEAQTRADPLWMGTGIHFALEDFHGKHLWKHPADAFSAYTQAWVDAKRAELGIKTNDSASLTSLASSLGKTKRSIMPEDFLELERMARSMLDYYEEWLAQGRETLETYKDSDGVFQTEVNFKIKLPMDQAILDSLGIDCVVASGTIDRVVIDDYGRLWLVDYKSAKVVKDDFFDTDPQISMYCWAASILWPEREIAGFIYQQHKKVIIKAPEFVKSTKMLSVVKTQSTTSALYSKAIINLYGSVGRAPAPCIEFLDWLTNNENEKQDRFIARHYVPRNAMQIEAEFHKLMAEAYDMINPDLALYPNPTRDCAWDCKFNTACIAMDDGGDWEHLLEIDMINRDEETETWK